MKLADLPTPCLVLDRQNMHAQHPRHGGKPGAAQVPLRPHMKTAKSIDVARLVLAGQPGGITVSTLAEAEYFASHGVVDILYAVGITPAKLDQVARINATGANVTVITDDPLTADAIAAHPADIKALIEIDCGEHRGGVLVAEDLILGARDPAGPQSCRSDDPCRPFLSGPQRRRDHPDRRAGTQPRGLCGAASALRGTCHLGGVGRQLAHRRGMPRR